MKKKVLMTLLMVVVVGAAVVLPTFGQTKANGGADADRLIGTWDAKSTQNGRDSEFELTFKKNAFGQVAGTIFFKTAKLTGELGSISVFAAGSVDFTYSNPRIPPLRFEGKLDASGQTMAGEWKQRATAETFQSGTWSAKKRTAAPTANTNPSLDMDGYVALIRTQSTANQLKDAIATATNCIKSFPSSVPCHSMRAQLNLRVLRDKPIDFANVKVGGKRDQEPEWLSAVADMSKVISIAPTVAEYYVQRGQIYVEGNNTEPPELAIADAKKALELKPTLAEAKSLLIKANATYASKLSREAMQDWVFAAGRRSTDAAEADKVLIAAIAKMDKVIAIGTSYTLFLEYQSRGRMHRDLGQYELAVADFTKSIELKNTDGTSYAERAETYRKLGRFTLALADYEAIDRLPANVDTQGAKASAPLGRADMYRESSDLKRAIVEYSKILSTDPTNNGALYGRGLAYFYDKQSAAAKADFEKLVAASWQPEEMKKELGRLGIPPYSTQYPPIPAGRALIPQIAANIDKLALEISDLFQRGDAKGADAKLTLLLAEADKAVAADKTFARSHELRGNVLIIASLVRPAKSADFLRSALAEFESAIAVDAKYGRAYFGRGIVYERLGDKTKARADQQKALELEPGNNDASTALKRLAN